MFLNGVFVDGINNGGSATRATFSPEMSGNVIVNTGPGVNILILVNNFGGTRDFYGQINLKIKFFTYFVFAKILVEDVTG